MDRTQQEDAFKNYTLVRNFSTYAFLHTEIYHVAFPLEKSLNLECSQSSFISERQDRSHWVARIEAPRGVGHWDWCPPPQLTRRSRTGESHYLPQWGLGQSPGRQCIFGIFEAHITAHKKLNFSQKTTQSID